MPLALTVEPSKSVIQTGVEKLCDSAPCVPDFLPCHVFQNYCAKGGEMRESGVHDAVTWLPESSYVFLLYYRNGGFEMQCEDPSTTHSMLSLFGKSSVETQIAICPETMIFFPSTGIARRGLPGTAFRGNCVRYGFFILVVYQLVTDIIICMWQTTATRASRACLLSRHQAPECSGPSCLFSTFWCWGESFSTRNTRFLATTDCDTCSTKTCCPRASLCTGLAKLKWPKRFRQAQTSKPANCAIALGVNCMCVPFQVLILHKLTSGNTKCRFGVSEKEPDGATVWGRDSGNLRENIF
jgi:hypothetical protein